VCFRGERARSCVFALACAHITPHLHSSKYKSIITMLTNTHTYTQVFSTKTPPLHAHTQKATTHASLCQIYTHSHLHSLNPIDQFKSVINQRFSHRAYVHSNMRVFFLSLSLSLSFSFSFFLSLSHTHTASTHKRAHRHTRTRVHTRTTQSDCNSAPTQRAGVCEWSRAGTSQLITKLHRESQT
jgi:hypothetical protein